MLDRPNDVVERDPAHVLPSRPNVAPEPQSERRQHLRERAARAAQDDAHPAGDDPYPRVSRRTRCRFPLGADLGQESMTGTAALVDDFVAAVSIDTDRRRRDEHRRFSSALDECAREERGAPDTTVLN